jgi:hypothetical protein
MSQPFPFFSLVQSRKFFTTLLPGQEFGLGGLMVQNKAAFSFLLCTAQVLPWLNRHSGIAAHGAV